MAQATITGLIDVVGDAAATVGKLATGHYGQHPVGDFLDVPAVSVPACAMDDTAPWASGVGQGVTAGPEAKK